MPRKKLSEYRSKIIISNALGLPYAGHTITTSRAVELGAGVYVVKVDQAVKGRFKKGLVHLGIKTSDVAEALDDLRSKGYESFIIEPLVNHAPTDERYLSLARDRRGIHISMSRQGGVDIESNTDSIETVTVDDMTNYSSLAEKTGFTPEQLLALVRIFESQHMTFLEINPYIIKESAVQLLDLAIEVDNAGSYFVDGWSEADFRRPTTQKTTDEEKTVAALDEKSAASFKLEVLDRDGAIFLLLSGGGASIVVADEVHNLGLGKQLANYGEYSGNPNTEEAYIYTSAVLSLLLHSAAPKKVLFIGGAVANFTDIANTFAGVIQAINERADQLVEQHVKVFVRRGGPRQEIGLAKIRTTLDKHGLLGAVHDPSTPLTIAVKEAVEEIK